MRILKVDRIRLFAGSKRMQAISLDGNKLFLFAEAAFPDSKTKRPKQNKYLPRIIILNYTFYSCFVHLMNSFVN